MYSRFDELRSALEGCANITLLNLVHSPGAYAWIYCDLEVTCVEYFGQVNLIGLVGSKYGVTGQCKLASLFVIAMIT